VVFGLPAMPPQPCPANEGWHIVAAFQRHAQHQETSPLTGLSSHPTQAAGTWFADFQSALEKPDIDAAMALFDADFYCRDLLAFTWNSR